MKRILSWIMSGIMLLLLLGAPVSAASSVKTSVQKESVLSALYDADITEIKAILDAGLLTSVELTQYYLERIDAYNEDYNCFITMCDDALQVAAQRDAQRAEGNAEGLLFGIPVVIKDNMDLEDYHTTNGFKKKADQIAADNADVVDYLLAEGAVIIAKANMSTEAQDARSSVSKAAGETKNAYSKYMSPGGSSGGSAVATSLNFAAAALGTDTNSSLRIPAALAGCVSLRPTFGLISTGGIKTLNSSRDVPGAITRSVYDQAIMLDVLTQGAYQYTKQLNPERIRGMRIGVLRQLSYALPEIAERTEQNIDYEVERAFENAIQELRSAGAEIVEVSMPSLFKLSNKTFSNNKPEPKEALYQAFKQLLADNEIEAVVYPTYLSTPIRARYDADGRYWDPYGQVYLNNCRTLSPSAGLPEISVPIGLHSLGAGIGMEIASLRNNEQLLLDIAYGYTILNDHRNLPDGAPNLYDAYAPVSVNGIAIVASWLEIVRGIEFGIPEKGNWHYLPQKPDYTDQPVDYTPYFIIAAGLMAAVCTFVVVLVKASKNRKRQRILKGKQPID